MAVSRSTKIVKGDGEQANVPYSVVHDLATGKTFALEDEATTFLLDASGRLWLGADHGEWGGRITRVDLAEGTLKSLKPPPSRHPEREAYWEGVYGFVEQRDGQVWAFGGTTHMGLNRGYLTRVDGAEPQPLYRAEPSLEPEAAPVPDRPALPITHVVEEDGGLLVFSFSDVFRVDRELKTWKKVATLEIQYRWGRPDAVGSYPSLRIVHPPIRQGEPYVLATVADGYVFLDGTKATSRGLPGQLGASGVYRVANTEEGTLLFDLDDRESAWSLGPKGWEVASLAPPFEADPANEAKELEEGSEDWYETRVLVGPGGTISTVSGTGVSDGTRTTARRVVGKSTRIGRETSSLDPSQSFITPDGTLWNLSSGELKRFGDGRWEFAASLPREDEPYRLEPIETQGPTWLLLDPFQNTLWKLENRAMGQKPEFTRLEIREGEKTLGITAAIPWLAGSLLLATDVGLRAYDPDRQSLAKVGFEEPPAHVSALVRDGLGRLWIGCKDGLRMVEAGGKTLTSFDLVSGIWSHEVEALAPDPAHPEGVIVLIGTQGVVYVRATQGPR